MFEKFSTPSRVIDVRVLSSANIGTDHNLLLMKITMGVELQSNNVKEAIPAFEKFNIESFNNQSTKDLYQRRLKE